MSPIRADQFKGCVALVGLPGTGKSTVGKLLAAELSWGFFDCDAGFEVETGVDIAGWVGDHGWTAFREHEVALLASALAREKIVIATGGGVVEDEKNRTMLAASATVVWLDAPLDLLVERVGAAEDRPLLAGNPRDRLQELGERRKPLYAAPSDVRVDVSDSDPAVVASQILRELVSRGHIQSP